MNLARGPIAAFIVATCAIVGCGRTNPQPVHRIGVNHFRQSTGLALPDGAECLNAKTMTVAFVGDTYYLRIATPKVFSDFLDANFERCAEAEQSLVPPAEWMKDMPFWDKAEIARAKLYYQKTHGSPDSWMFVSAIAYNEAARIAHFVGAECR